MNIKKLVVTILGVLLVSALAIPALSAELFIYKHDDKDYVGGQLFFTINDDAVLEQLVDIDDVPFSFTVVAMPDPGYRLKAGTVFYTHYKRDSNSNYDFQWNILEGVKTSAIHWDNVDNLRIQIAPGNGSDGIWETGPFELDPYYVGLFLYKHEGVDYVGGKLHLEIDGNPTPVQSASANLTTRFKIVAVPDAGYKLKDDADFYTHYYSSYVKNVGNDFAWQWNIAAGVETSVLPWDVTLTGVRIQVAATDWQNGPFEEDITAPLDLAKLEKWLKIGWDLKLLIDAEDGKFSDKSPIYYNGSYLWNTNGVQTLYSYLVDSTHNVLNNPAATQAEVDLAVSNLKAAYKGALDVLNLHIAKIKLNNWVYKASDLIDILKANGLWNEDATQNLYNLMVSGHNDVYNVSTATISDVKEALAKLKAAYPDALALLDVLAQAKAELKSFADLAWDLKLELQYFVGMDLWNTPACQTLYNTVLEAYAVYEKPNATLGEISDVLARLKAAYAEAQTLWDLPLAKAELKSLTDAAWVVVRTLQASPGAILWNTPACQTLYEVLTREVYAVSNNPTATLVEIKAALANLYVAIEDAAVLLP